MNKKNRRNPSTADTEIIISVKTGKRTSRQPQDFIEGRNPFDKVLSPCLVDINDAIRILGEENVRGSQALQKAKLKPDDALLIPFSEEELIRAKELDLMLVLITDTLANGLPATMKNMYEFFQPIFNEQGLGQVLYNIDWYKDNEFYTKDTPRPGWRLVSKAPIKESFNKNHLQQTEVLVEYLRKVFADQTMPEKYQKAIDEFNDKCGHIQQLFDKQQWQEAALILSELEINQLRRSPVEAMQSDIVSVLNNNERLLKSVYDWSMRIDSGSGLVVFGYSGARGPSVGGFGPDNVGGNLGGCYSRGL